jgi:hypothetical protein
MKTSQVLDTKFSPEPSLQTGAEFPSKEGSRMPRSERFRLGVSGGWTESALLALILLNLCLAPMAHAVVILPCCFATNLLGGYCWLCPAMGNDFPCASNENDQC